MNYTLVQRASARRDILTIIDRIADDNPTAAEAVYEAYEHSLRLLRSTPDMGRLYDSDHPRLAGIRFVPLHRYRNYLIFYRRSAATVEVLHVWHGARDIPTLLEGEGEDG
jgi:toxin ParE1/3/4